MPWNKTIFKTFFLLCSLLVISSVQAEKSIAECVKKTTNDSSSASISRCLDSVISHVDRELETWVNLHSFNLEELALINGRYSALNMFKRAQTNFITYRENDCRWQYLAISPARGADVTYKKCYVKLTNNRIYTLSNIKSSVNTP